MRGIEPHLDQTPSIFPYLFSQLPSLPYPFLFLGSQPHKPIPTPRIQITIPTVNFTIALTRFTSPLPLDRILR